MTGKAIRTAASTLAVGLAVLTLTFPARAAGPLSHEQAVEDTRFLINTLEQVHPDPYVRGGGKIAFHRRLQAALEAIPDSGITVDELYLLVRPLVAAVGDAHTTIFDPRQADPYAPGGIPLYFATGLDGLYVTAVLAEEHRELIGGRLVSVEGVAFGELVERCRRLRGADNDYLLYQNLGNQGVLWYRHLLTETVPEWTRTDSISIQLRLADDRIVGRSLAIPERVDYATFIFPPISDQPLLVDLMARQQKSDIYYRFLDSSQQTCLLAIRNLSTYREAFEVWDSYGISSREADGRVQYERYNGSAPPDDYAAVLAGLPSATELFSTMVDDMKAAGTTNLIIDLCQNDGGSSVISHVLLYFLYGKETAIAVRGRTTEIVKYSPEYFERFPSPSLDMINQGRRLRLTTDDYDLDSDYGHRGYPGRDRVLTEMEEMIARMPTFEAEYTSGDYSSGYRPENVLILCDAGTFSAAFTLMYYLRQAGAEIAGVPSAQAGNCFGDLIGFQLPHSRLEFNTSRKYFELFPGDPDTGEVMMPDYPLTYAKMVQYDFDVNMWLLFARDLLSQRGQLR